MADFLLLMHNDGGPESDADWAVYLAKLEQLGVMRGGSAIGAGACVRKTGAVPPVTAHLAGFIRIEARDLTHARELLAGNPTYEAGGTVEIRELPKTG